MYRRVAPFSVKSIRLLVTSLEKTNVPSSGKPKGKRGQEKENVPPGPPKRKKTKAGTYTRIYTCYMLDIHAHVRV